MACKHGSALANKYQLSSFGAKTGRAWKHRIDERERVQVQLLAPQVNSSYCLTVVVYLFLVCLLLLDGGGKCGGVMGDVVAVVVFAVAVALTAAVVAAKLQNSTQKGRDSTGTKTGGVVGRFRGLEFGAKIHI